MTAATSCRTGVALTTRRSARQPASHDRHALHGRITGHWPKCGTCRRQAVGDPGQRFRVLTGGCAVTFIAEILSRIAHPAGLRQQHGATEGQEDRVDQCGLLPGPASTSSGAVWTPRRDQWPAAASRSSHTPATGPESPRCT